MITVSESPVWVEQDSRQWLWRVGPCLSLKTGKKWWEYCCVYADLHVCKANRAMYLAMNSFQIKPCGILMSSSHNQGWPDLMSYLLIPGQWGQKTQGRWRLWTAGWKLASESFPAEHLGRYMAPHAAPSPSGALSSRSELHSTMK